MRKLSALVILGLLTVGLALPAQAHSFYGEGDCDGWTLHLDGTWGAYDITVDGSSIGLEQNPQIPDDSDATSRTFVVVWLKQSPVTRTVTVERSLDCDSETTTTLPEETTTTIPEVTTTTVESTTSTTAGTTTTIPGETTFVVTVVCLPNGTFEVGAEFGDGVERVEATLLDALFPPTNDFDGVTLTPENPTTWGSVVAPAQFQATAFPRDGYVIVGTNPVILDVDVCPQETTTTPPPTVPVSPPELPFTGPAGLIGLLIAGMVTVGIGTVLVREFGSE